MTTVSLCMIVRNEEKVLARCLDSVRGIADEICITDTGSTDKTREIARKYGTVQAFPWCDDFSAARNFSFAQARMDYTLWLDADDVLDEENLEKLKRHGYEMIDPVCGMLANGDTGDGKLPSEETLVEYVLRELAFEKDMQGLKVLVTAGPTQEAIDPVRFISNHSTGKMGYAIAKNAMLRGAEVTLVTGRTALEPPMFVKTVPVTSAKDMYQAVMECAKEQDIIVKAAAVADYTPAHTADEKIKKSEGELSLALEKTTDILAELGKNKGNTVLCGFSMETEHMLENSRAKRKKKNLDMIAANNLKQQGAGFAGDTNVLTLITEDWEKELALMSKDEAAKCLLDELLKIKKNKK